MACVVQAALRSPLAASMVLADYFDEMRPVEAGLRRAWQLHAAAGGMRSTVKRAVLPAAVLVTYGSRRNRTCVRQASGLQNRAAAACSPRRRPEAVTRCRR